MIIYSSVLEFSHVEREKDRWTGSSTCYAEVAVVHIKCCNPLPLHFIFLLIAAMCATASSVTCAQWLTDYITMFFYGYG